MKRFVLSFLILVSTSPLFSQKLFFVYLQSEQAQPFFLRMADKVHSSSAAGFLILSKLHDSTYNVTIGFPENKWPEQRISFDVRGKDRGFLLKDFGEKGWGLFDLQTLGVTMATPANKSSSIRTELREVSAFTDILAKAANDPSLREQQVVMKEEKVVAVQPAVLREEVSSTVPAEAKAKEGVKSETETPKYSATAKSESEEPVNSKVVKEDTSITNKKQEEKTPPKTEPLVEAKKPDTSVAKEVADTKKEKPATAKPEEPIVKPDSSKAIPKQEEVAIIPEVKNEVRENAPVTTEEYKRSTVTKRSESSTSEGFGLTFIDEYPDGKRDTVRIIIPNPKRSLTEVKETEKTDRKFLDLPAENGQPKMDTISKTATVSVPPKEKQKLRCIGTSSDNDFLKLRKRMAAETKEDDMVAEAKKTFRSRCFSVAHLKNLSALFLTDAGKYSFFEVAHPFVSDPDNFATLSAELKEESYVNRFKTMLR
ncbi:MAG: hypothetical protein H7Y42_01100 [Chitinophagaceae bacterium]|nr:hypothetical protein [Chitinophagaceae bacterium]